VSYVVGELEVGLRADVFLAKVDDRLSRSEVQRLISSQQVLLNSKPLRSSIKLKLGDCLELLAAESRTPSTLEPSKMSLDILYEDDHLIVINKPPGLLMHPGAGLHGPTLVEGVLAHIGATAGEGLLGEEAQRPGVVHRLDKGTSGVVVFAKDRKTHEELAQQFKEKTNLREYVALVCGHQLTKAERIESYLHRDPYHRIKFRSVSMDEYHERFANEQASEAKGYRWAASMFVPLRSYPWELSLIKCRLETGRTHQIRVHAATRGMPVVGDPLYQDRSRFEQQCEKMPRQLSEQLLAVGHQLLHAQTLGFIHPQLKEKVAFSVDPPDSMKGVLNTLQASADTD